jgi:hypothetical protein
LIGGFARIVLKKSDSCILLVSIQSLSLILISSFGYAITFLIDIRHYTMLLDFNEKRLLRKTSKKKTGNICIYKIATFSKRT